jgi:SAM-dependent methyltransferase
VYKSIAKYYDLLGWGEFHDIAFPRLKPLLLEHRCKSYLDLACGTGSLAFSVARMGIEVVGLDKSKEMLAMAEQRLKRFGGKIKPEFVKRDMTRFNLKCQFDAVGCFFDAPNHLLTEDGFSRFIVSASRHLKPGGFFIFDVNTVRGLRNWDAILFTERGEHAILMKGSYDRSSRLAAVTISGFVKLAGGKRDRFKETFYERGYPHKFIVSCLKKAGFGDIEATPSKAGTALRAAGRVFYTAYKK